MTTSSPSQSWAPLRHPLFRWLWIAALVSQTGAFMTDVAQGWLMTTLVASPLAVALLTTAESVPFFLLSLPAGALADVADRRRLLLGAQGALALASAVLTVVTAAGLVTPAVLLALACATGVASALNNPAWYAMPAEILPKEDLASGVTWNGVALNIARVLGPALGGLVVLASGPAVVFALDAITTLAVIAWLLAWRRERPITVLPAERLLGAVKAGFRFARHSTELRRVLLRVLLRTLAFVFCACAVLALLPLLARETNGGALAYGLLLGSFGIGAVAGAALLARWRARCSTDTIVSAGSVMFGCACAGVALLRNVLLLCPILMCAGVAWMSVLSSFNVAAQSASPAWVRARALAVYLLVFQGSIATGSAVWGVVAEHAGMPVALLAAGAGLAAGALLLARVRLEPGEQLDLTPTRHWPEPAALDAPDLESGPVIVEVAYSIDPTRANEFVAAARALERIRRRDGAVEWWLLRDPEQPPHYVEIFVVETWAEHLRQHARVSVADRAIEDRVVAFHAGGGLPPARHLLSVPGAIQRRGPPVVEQTLRP